MPVSKQPIVDMALAGRVVVGDAMAEGVVTVLQKSSDSWAEAIIIIAAATRADVNLKETIVGCDDRVSVM